jgi:aryl-alcohol dehydrogenase-like predicted oxidoreductase
MGVFAIRILAAGILAGVELPDDTASISPGSEVPKERRRVEAIRTRLGLSRQELYSLALRFVLAKEGVSAALIGFSKPDQIDASLEVLNSPMVGEDVMAKLKDTYATEAFSA